MPKYTMICIQTYDKKIRVVMSNDPRLTHLPIQHSGLDVLH